MERLTLATIMENRIAERLALLQGIPFHILRTLPARFEEKIETQHGSVVITTWVDTIGNDAVRVVVQAYKRRWLGFGWMKAQGFLAREDGSFSAIIGEELSDYL